MIKEQKKEINGARYTVKQFAARRGLKIKSKLVKILAPTAIAAVKGKGKLSLESNADLEMISNAIKSMLDNLDSDNIVNFIFETFLKEVADC